MHFLFYEVYLFMSAQYISEIALRTSFIFVSDEKKYLERY